MTTINVEHTNLLPQPVRLTVDEICQHNRAEFEDVENSSGHTSMELFCQDCDAQWNDLDERWMEV